MKKNYISLQELNFKTFGLSEISLFEMEFINGGGAPWYDFAVAIGGFLTAIPVPVVQIIGVSLMLIGGIARFIDNPGGGSGGGNSLNPYTRNNG